MLFDAGYYDQKWSLWDTWKGVGRNVRTYVLVAGYKLVQAITLQNRRANAITTQNRRGKIITGV